MSTLQNQQLVLTPARQTNYFGLLPASAEDCELHGFEITLEGQIVIPELLPRQTTGARAEEKHDVAHTPTTLA